MCPPKVLPLYDGGKGVQCFAVCPRSIKQAGLLCASVIPAVLVFSFLFRWHCFTLKDVYALSRLSAGGCFGGHGS